MTKQDCVGCRNDFYNGNNELGVAECWSFKTAVGARAMKTRTLEICGATLDEYDRCERVLAEGEACPEHPLSEGITVEYEPLDEFTWDDVEVYE